MRSSETFKPLIRFLQEHAPHASIPENPTVYELAKTMRVWARGDPFAERLIRQAEDEEQRDRQGRSLYKTKEQMVQERALAQTRSDEWWAMLDARVHELIDLHLWKRDGPAAEARPFIAAMGQVLAEGRKYVRKLVGEESSKVQTRLGEVETAFWKKRESDEKRHNALADEATQKIAALERELADARRKLADTKRELGAIRHEIKAAMDVDERFRQLERSMAARQVALDEAKRGSEIERGDLPAKIEKLQRQIDDLKRVAAQPGPQGPPGPPGTNRWGNRPAACG